MADRDPRTPSAPPSKRGARLLGLLEPRVGDREISVDECTVVAGGGVPVKRVVQNRRGIAGVVVCQDVHNPEEALAVAARIVEAMRKLLELAGSAATPGYE